MLKSTCPMPHMYWYGTRVFRKKPAVTYAGLISEDSGEHVGLRNLVRVSLLTNIKLTQTTSTYVVFLISYEFGGFLSVNNSIHIITAFL